MLPSPWHTSQPSTLWISAALELLHRCRECIRVLGHASCIIAEMGIQSLCLTSIEVKGPMDIEANGPGAHVSIALTHTVCCIHSYAYSLFRESIHSQILTLPPPPPHPDHGIVYND